MIAAAREAYDALTNERKKLVSAYETLTRAESAYARFVAYYDEIESVIEKIDAIGEVSYTNESARAIKDARSAYDALTEEQKALVDN